MDIGRIYEMAGSDAVKVDQADSSESAPIVPT